MMLGKGVNAKLMPRLESIWWYFGIANEHSRQSTCFLPYGEQCEGVFKMGPGLANVTLYEYISSC